MSILQIYGKEIFAAIVALLPWGWEKLSKRGVKVQYAVPYEFTFLVQEPLRGANGEVVRSTQSVHVASTLIYNNGDATAAGLEITFNYKPQCFNIWPSRPHQEYEQADRRFSLIFSSLAPKEEIRIERINVNHDLPTLLNIRCEQGAATRIKVRPAKVLPRWLLVVLQALLGLGLATLVYLLVLLAQYLIIGTPFGRPG